MEKISHLNDETGRPICNKFRKDGILKDWDNRGEINCRECILFIERVRLSYNKLRHISKQIEDANTLLEVTDYGREELLQTKKDLEKEERKHHPRSMNEAY